MARQFHRPARLDPAQAEQLPGSEDVATLSTLAHTTAQALVGGFPCSEGIDPFSQRDIAEMVGNSGVDAVAELWDDSPATTLPGALWRVFLVHTWITRDPQLIERRYATPVDVSADTAAGERLERALSEARRVPSISTIAAHCEHILGGHNDSSVRELEPLLREIADFLRALAAGSSPLWIDDADDELSRPVTTRDSALLLTAAELDEAADRARTGILD